MKQQHAEIVAKNAPQEQGQTAEEKQLKFSEDRQQQSPEIAGTQQQAEPGEKQLRFSEDREPRGNSLDHNEERSDAKQAERPGIRGKETLLLRGQEPVPAERHRALNGSISAQVYSWAGARRESK